MVASEISSPPVAVESKSAKKRKAKAVAAAAATAVERVDSPAPPSEKAASGSGHESADETPEVQKVRELQKLIRNVTKKIGNLAKTESLVAEHKDKSLAELVFARIINADQKQQLDKKPELERQVKLFEEQLEQFKKFDQDSKARLAAQEKALTDKFEKEKADLTMKSHEEAMATTAKVLNDSLLVLSQFLRLAAARRAEDIDASADENLALEGVLLQVYAGDENAVATMLKLVHGLDEQTRSTTNDVLQTTFAQVKQAATANSAPLFQSEPAAQTESEAAEFKEVVGTDPTLVHASLTEIDEGSNVAFTNGHVQEHGSSTQHALNVESVPSPPPPNTVVDSAANGVAENHWDTTAPSDMAASHEWVKIQAPVETEINAPINLPASQSWADDQPEMPTEAPASGDGFHQVQRNHNRSNRDGGHRGRGGHRARGSYGGGRGRGRGGPRGGANGMPMRNGSRRGGDES